MLPLEATWMDLESVLLSEVSQREISYDIACMQNFFKMIQMNLFTKHTDTHRLRKLTYGYGRGAGREKRIVREFGIDMYTLLYLKWISNKDLLVHSTWNSAQCYVAAWLGREFGGDWIHVYVWLSSFTVHQKLSQHY